MDNIVDTLNSLSSSLAVTEQYRRASLFKLVCSNAGFTERRIGEICRWIQQHPTGCIFKSWANVLNYVRDDEVGAWYEVAQFLAEGGEVVARPYELSAAESLCVSSMRARFENLYLSSPSL